jgi:primosomal protein N' (replication factor Y)
MTELPENPPSPKLAALVVISGLPKVLSYESCVGCAVGCEVTVELGRRKAKGWVIEMIPLAEAEQLQNKPRDTQTSFLEKPILKPVLEASPVFRPEQLQLFRWMSEYYGAPLADIIDNAVPRKSIGKTLRYISLAKEISEAKELAEEIARRAPRQSELLTQLIELNREVAVSELRSSGGSVDSALKSLAKRGFVSFSERNAFWDSETKQGGLYTGVRPKKLSPHQQQAVEKIGQSLASGGFTPYLLYGVTGSGKTEVYLRAIEQALASQGGAIVIIPEISLTPQFVDQFRARLNVPIALLHSQVGSTPRWEAWQALLRGDIKVAIGARSAVFAPVQDLKLVIVDEEHESSYKQSDGLRYHARDVAVMRAKFANANILLGSATPSFESLLNVRKKRYQILELPERVSTRPVPEIEIVDLNQIKRKEMPSENISPALHEAISQTLSSKGQIVIFYNKRGFASYLQCQSCNEVVSCPNCTVPLTYHLRKNSLLCHYCALAKTPPERCPECRNPETTRVERELDGELIAKEKDMDKIGKLVQRGAGTEKVVDELAVLYPEARVVRMDRDTVGKKGAYREILGKMRSGEADILVGTQMIAKGHDLPGVTLVGIINADIGLHVPDFRSSEKIFQLITQAAGRAGRGSEPGRVLVQTREPHHPTIVATVTGRFKAFARYELDFRKSLGYPPMGRLLRLVISSEDQTEAHRATETTLMALKHLIELDEDKEQRCEILGPAPAAYEKLRGRYRWHFLVKSRSASKLSGLASSLYKWKSGLKNFKDFRLAIDVDPFDML